MHYNFAADLEEGHRYEQYLLTKFRSNGIPAYLNPYTDYERMKAFDLYVPPYLIEVKADYMMAQTRNICLETDLLISAADYYIINDWVFSRLDIWRIIGTNYGKRKWVGKPKVEVVCPPIEIAYEYGQSLTSFITPQAKR